MANDNFNGDKKSSQTLVYNAEFKIVEKILPHIPLWIKSYHLTLLTIVWSVFILFFSFMAQDDINWMWLVSLMIFLQYLTDLFDGRLGKYRRANLIKWGYYMDHFLDFIFTSSIIIGYSFLLPQSGVYLFFILLTVSSLLVSVYLSFSVTNEFKFSFLKIGPTEGRFLLIALNVMIVFLGIQFFVKTLPYILGFLLLSMMGIVYNTQKHIWQIDMKNKADER